MAARSSEKPNISRADVTRQAELVAMEFLKSRKCTQTLDAMMQSSRRTSASVVASDLFAVDLDAKKRVSQAFPSVLDYLVSESSRRVATEALAVAPETVVDESIVGTKHRRRRSSSSVSSESSDSGNADWTKDAVSRLKKAIKQTSRVEDKNERWREIATLVGKSKKHCYVKYKELKAEKKAGGGVASSRSSSPSPSPSNRWTSEIREVENVGDSGSGHDTSSREEKTKAAPSQVVPSTSDSADSSWTTSRQAHAKTVSWDEPTAPLAGLTLESGLQLEDVDDFESVQPTHSPWTQPTTSSNSNSYFSSCVPSSYTSSASVSSRGGRTPTPHEVASLQQLLFASEKTGFSAHWEHQVRRRSVVSIVCRLGRR